MYKKIVIIFIFCTFILIGCKRRSISHLNEESRDNNLGTNEVEVEMLEDDDKEKSQEFVEEKNNAKETNDDFFSPQAEHLYNVDVFLEESIDEVPINVTELANYEEGNVYKLNIIYDDCPGRYFWDVSDRFDLGMFYVVDDKIYLISGDDEIPTENDFISNGIEVYSTEDSEKNIEGLRITIKNTDDSCTCTMTNTLTESGYYSIYEWNKEKELKYYCSGYGAGGDLIELEIK